MNLPPEYNIFKVFGCACYPCMKPYNTHKFQFHSTKCVFIGYNRNYKGYKCLSASGRIFVLRHVIFNEDELPFEKGFLNKRQNVNTTEPISFYPLITKTSTKGADLEEHFSDNSSSNVEDSTTDHTTSEHLETQVPIGELEDRQGNEVQEDTNPHNASD